MKAIFGRVKAVATEVVTAYLLLGLHWGMRRTVALYRALERAQKRMKATKTEEALAQARLAACRVCPFKRGDLCSKCGCYMPAKVYIRQAKCPQGNW